MSSNNIFFHEGKMLARVLLHVLSLVFFMKEKMRLAIYVATIQVYVLVLGVCCVCVWGCVCIVCVGGRARGRSTPGAVYLLRYFMLVIYKFSLFAAGQTGSHKFCEILR